MPSGPAMEFLFNPNWPQPTITSAPPSSDGGVLQPLKALQLPLRSLVWIITLFSTLRLL